MEEDILKEPIKEEIKDDEPIMTRGSTTDGLLAKSIYYTIDGHNGCIRVDSITMGSYYKVTTPYGDIPSDSYYVRGQETIETSNGTGVGIYSMYTNLYSNTSGWSWEYVVIEEPTPEPTTEPTPEPIDPETISGNELLREILITERGIEENVQSIANRPVYICVSNNNVSDNQIVSVDNIMSKPINEYSVSESLMMFLALSLFIGGIVVIIRKGLPSCR